jgi:exopolysaccharide production protein ExoQ
MSLRRLAVVLFCIAAAVGFARQFQPRDIILMAATILGAYLVVGLATELVLGTFRPWASEYRFAGTFHPNTQGSYLGIFCLAMFCLARSANRGTKWLWFVFAIGFIFLLLTKSRTACAAMMLAIVAIAWNGVSMRTRLFTVFFAGFFGCLAALTLLWSDGKTEGDLTNAAMLGRQEESEGLTGRVPLWNVLLVHAHAKPLQGYGYEAFWTEQNIETVCEDVQWLVREAHNSYLDSVLSVGLIGTALFLACVLLSLCRAAITHSKTPDGGLAFAFGLLIFGIITGCLESGMMSANLTTLLVGCGVFQLFACPENSPSTSDAFENPLYQKGTPTPLPC